jgi:uncharacterized RDD family membrane protein YckC
MTRYAEDPAWISLKSAYAGVASRFAAYLIDIAVSSGAFTIALAAITYAVSVVTGRPVAWSRENVAVAVAFAAWLFLYFACSWAAGGQSPGMAVLGIRVVRADGSRLPSWRAALRALTFPLSFLLLGLGFAGILVQREHRALHDLISGSAVVYSWDARAARLRFLSRQADVRSMAPVEAFSPEKRA